MQIYLIFFLEGHYFLDIQYVISVEQSIDMLYRWCSPSICYIGGAVHLYVKTYSRPNTYLVSKHPSVIFCSFLY